MISPFKTTQEAISTHWHISIHICACAWSMQSMCEARHDKGLHMHSRDMTVPLIPGLHSALPLWITGVRPAACAARGSVGPSCHRSSRTSRGHRGDSPDLRSLPVPPAPEPPGGKGWRAFQANIWLAGGGLCLGSLHPRAVWGPSTCSPLCMTCILSISLPCIPQHQHPGGQVLVSSRAVSEKPHYRLK